MRINEKRKMTAIMEQYQELCELIPNWIRRGKMGEMPVLLQNIQEASIDWGETIEALAEKTGEDGIAEVVTALEEMCERCYSISVDLEKGMTGKKWLKQTESALRAAVKRVRQAIDGIPLTYEFVFMPYKASMWDSLESIYLAAARDNNCVAYVVPVPFYEIEPNTGRKTYCYEGELFPDKIPVTHYLDFNLKNHHPDAIFIHNPYDDSNLVTQLDTAYFSPRLKACTEELVYVPYYSTAGVTPELHRLLPVHQSMDHMVIQCEKEMQYYDHPVLSGKLLPLGSPKVDKIINSMQGDEVYPEGWKEILFGKKVFFFNTSITSLLGDTECAVLKLNYIFSCFKKRKDAAIIWRPHPLLEATLRSLRPDYYDRFLKIQQEFLENGIGVLDKSPDASVAIRLSDAYIGEASSSIIHLFGVAGKPIYFLNYRILEEPKPEQLSDVRFTNIVECNGRLWTFLTMCNALCNMDSDSGAIHIVTSIPGYHPFRGGLVSSLYAVGADLILSPSNMDRIAIYHTDSGQFDFIPLPNPRLGGNLGRVCEESVLGELTGRFFILPNRYEAIAEYDPGQKRFRFHTKVMQAIREIGTEHRTDRSWFGGVWYSGDCGKMILALARSNYIVIWDTQRDEFEIRELGTPGCGWGAMLRYRDGFLLREYCGARFWYWNWETDTCVEAVTDIPDSFTARMNPRKEEHPYGGFFPVHDHLLLFPRLGNEILELEVTDEWTRTMYFSPYDPTREIRLGQLPKMGYFDTSGRVKLSSIPESQENIRLQFHTFPVDISSHIREPQTGLHDNRYGNLGGIYNWADREMRMNKQVHELWIRFSADGQTMHLDTDTMTYREFTTHADITELKSLLTVSQAFGKQGEAAPYAAKESLFVSLPQFIDALVEGQLKNNREEQLDAYRAVNANMDGTCGQKVFDTICDILKKKYK
jgi:hypothetical protein